MNSRLHGFSAVITSKSGRGFPGDLPNLGFLRYFPDHLDREFFEEHFDQQISHH